MENATLLYVQACRFLLCGEDRSSWDELMLVLPRLRNALTCRVCRGLIVDPLGSKYCQHYVCKACLKRKRALNPGCKWCLDWTKLQESDGEVRVVLACYKLLCEAIKSSNYYEKTVKNSSIDNLLNEALSNTDVLPNSSFVPSNSTPILESKSNMAKMEVEVVSRDAFKACAREKVESNSADNTGLDDGGKFNSDANAVTETKNGISQPSDENVAQHSKSSVVAMVEKKNNQLQQDEIKIATSVTGTNCTNSKNNGNDTNIKSYETDNNGNRTNINGNDSHINGNGHINGDNEIQINSNSQEDPISCKAERNSEIDHEDSKAHFVQKARPKNVRACLRPRNGQLVQKFEASRCMRKRNMNQVNKIVKKNNAQTFSKSLDQIYRPKKRCKIE